MVSILVPVYNSEKYLSFCLSSLASQDYGPMEILVLDDGSSDHSLSISEEFSRRDGRIRVIKEKSLSASAIDIDMNSTMTTGSFSPIPAWSFQAPVLMES